MNEGQARYLEGRVDRIDAEGRWWRFEAPFLSPTFSYRFELHNGRTVEHVNGAGVHGNEPTDAADFRLLPGPGIASWARMGVFYQILIDRFWRSPHAPRPARDLASWSDPVDGPPSAARFYGGDLLGIQERLDHLNFLGVSAICLTPFFPSPEPHRYSASSFDHVDPMLGGDEALVRLLNAIHDRGMYCIGDLTLNHCGNTHSWFRDAIADQTSVEAGMFHFTAFPDNYATYSGVKNLPKFNYSSAEIHERMYRKRDSVARAWLKKPFCLDGWRIDAASMVARLGSLDANHNVARGVRAAVSKERHDAFLVAEIPHDAALDLGFDGWPGALMDAGLASPIRRWVSAQAVTGGIDLYLGLSGFAAAMPWQSLVSSVGFVGSHDYSRLLSVAGSRERALAAFFVLLTLPSIPMIYAGDEFGMLGDTAEHAREPLPWPGTGWDADPVLCQRLTEIVRLRRTTPALGQGGLRWLMASDDAIAFERADENDRIICLASRASTTVTFSLPGAGLAAEPLLSSSPGLHISGDTVKCTCKPGRLYGAWRLHEPPG
jgi:alpha-glucosidase